MWRDELSYVASTHCCDPNRHFIFMRRSAECLLLARVPVSGRRCCCCTCFQWSSYKWPHSWKNGIIDLVNPYFILCQRFSSLASRRLLDSYFLAIFAQVLQATECDLVSDSPPPHPLIPGSADTSNIWPFLANLAPEKCFVGFMVWQISVQL